MSLKIYDDSKNYTAQVISLPVKQAVQGLDNLVEVNVFGNSCLVGKDSPENELYLFFPAGAQLSHEFVSKNNLYRDSQLNADPNAKGFFEPNRRVKAIKFKGIISSGFVIPLQGSLKYKLTEVAAREIDSLKVGDEFNEIDGIEVCRKYFVPVATQVEGKGDKSAKINNKLVQLLVPNQFRFHAETSHLAKHLNSVPHDGIIVITDKWHGSSCILSKVLITKKLNRWQRLLNYIGGKIPAKEYGYIYSSGKPKSNLPKGIEGEWINNNPDYYISNIWKRAFDTYKYALEDGVSLYGELVGFTEGGQFIQKGYDYGCEGLDDLLNGKYRFIIYRITYTKPDGNTIEFSWQQIKDYCKKYNLEHAQEFFFGTIWEWLKDFYPEFPDNGTAPITIPEQALFDALQTHYNMEKDCIHCKNKVPAEGLVLRVDGKTSFNAYKLKAKRFLKNESDALDKGEINIEDNT